MQTLKVGNVVTKKAFVKWIRAAERGPSIPLQEAKFQWLNKKKDLLKFAK